MDLVDKQVLSKDQLGKGHHTLQEIYSQTDAWQGALREVEAKKTEFSKILSGNYQQIIFTGCGSSYYLSLTAASLFQSVTGLPCRAVPAGELLMSPQLFYVKGNTLLFSISRSGSTTETVRAVREFKQSHAGKVIAITNYSDQPLPEISDLAFCIPEGQEQSVAQTRSFSSMSFAAAALAMIASNQKGQFEEMYKLPEIGQRMMKKYNAFAQEVGSNLEYDRFYFLGSGHRYGVACEANLKMKEMSQTHTEAYHFLEFRHGPQSMVNEKTVMVGLLSESQREYEEKVLFEMKGISALVVSLSEKNGVISFESGLDENIRTILYLPMLQIMAFYRSIAKGLDPDNPKNLAPVVLLD